MSKVNNTKQIFFEVKNLHQEFKVKTAGFFQAKKKVKAVDGVSFAIKEGEVLGIVGESGCGKSSVAKSILNIYPPKLGKVIFNDKNILKYSEKKWRKLRRDIQYIFQDPLGSLDPRMTIIDQIIEPLIIHKIGNKKTRITEALELLNSVGLTHEMASKYPHELSGGQRQRVVLARALTLKPKFLICDEPVSALDVSIQAQVILLLEKLKRELNLTILFISHDLSLVRYLCDNIVVMYLGKIVEQGPVELIYNNPKHPYTKALMSAIPASDPFSKKETIILTGEPPSSMNPPSGCRFHPRCPMANDSCTNKEQELLETKQNYEHKFACHMISEKELK